MAAAAKMVGARAGSTKKRPPEKFEPKEVNLLEGLPKPKDVEAQAKSPYPEGVQYYEYKPQDGGKSILLALNGFDPPDKLWFFDLAQLPKLSQTWLWMDRAKVPKAIQRQAQMLPDAEYFKMFDEWFEVMKLMRGGGPKGAVTAGK
jgi:hypothetical protein